MQSIGGFFTVEKEKEIKEGVDWREDAEKVEEYEERRTSQMNYFFWVAMDRVGGSLD